MAVVSYEIQSFRRGITLHTVTVRIGTHSLLTWFNLPNTGKIEFLEL